jgi:GT2 family glycosyltransferase
VSRSPLLSVIVKTLNEEAHIAQTLESLLAETRGLEAEIIVADCLSTDQTVVIARRYPVQIVQLANIADKGCGAAPQLGFQHTTGAFVYVMDGDMIAAPGFLAQALDLLQRDASLAGVGGLIVEANVRSLEFASRVLRAKKDLQPGLVDRLNGGGLYRRSAIEQVGYLSDRNLHAYEELELAQRLRSAGWRLARLPMMAVEHHGHTLNAYKLLWRRFRTRYAWGVGEILRAGALRNEAGAVFRDLPELRLYGIVLVWWAIMLGLATLAPRPEGAWLAALLFALPFAAMSLLRRSVSLGVYAVVSWHVNLVSALAGFFAPRRHDPRQPIASVVLHTPQMVEQAANSSQSAGR